MRRKRLPCAFAQLEGGRACDAGQAGTWCRTSSRQSPHEPISRIERPGSSCLPSLLIGPQLSAVW